MQAPYGQQPDPNHHARLLLGLFPEEVRKAASPAEMNARLAEARRLGGQASDIRLDPLLRSQARAQAQRVLTAPAGDALVRKAIERDQAGRLADEAAARAVAKAKAGQRHPVLVYSPGHRPLGTVPRSAIITKASKKTTPMQAVFDQEGNLIGVVDPAQIQPVAGHGRAAAQAPQDQAQPQAPAQAPAAAPAAAPGQAQVAKADADLVQQVLKALGPKWIPVHDMWGGTPVGVVRRKHILPPGQVMKAAATDVANVYDARRRRVGTALLADITDLATLRAARARGRSGR